MCVCVCVCVNRAAACSAQNKELQRTVEQLETRNMYDHFHYYYYYYYYYYSQLLAVCLSGLAGGSDESVINQLCLVFIEKSSGM